MSIYSREGDDDSEDVDAQNDGGRGGEGDGLAAGRAEHSAVPYHHLAIRLVETMSINDGQTIALAATCPERWR